MREPKNQMLCTMVPQMQLTLIYLTHFEDVQCQSGVNHINEE